MDDEAPYWKYLVPWNGECVDNADPQRLGRVQVFVPGLLEPSGWVLPRGFGGVHYDVPKTRANYKSMTPSQNRPGDECEVVFLGGDPDQPRYMRAHGGIPDGVTPEVPEPVKTMAIADAPLVKAHEFGNWLIVCDDRAATKGMRITDKFTGEVFVEYDAIKMATRIKAVSGLALDADGAVTINGLVVTINGRRVLTSKDAI
jgi:hypothetical protein